MRSGSSLLILEGTDTGTPFAWTVDDSASTGFPAVIRYIGGNYVVPGNIVRLFARSASPYLPLR